MPTPTGLGQDEKDRRGAAERATLQAQADRYWRQQTRPRWTNDDQLPDLTLPELHAEAELRRVQLPTPARKPAVVAALRKATADLDRQ
jgi:hypothetical protein